MVQFARTDGSGIEVYALKFFAVLADFQEEAEVYRTSPLRRFMPNVVKCELLSPQTFFVTSLDLFNFPGVKTS